MQHRKFDEAESVLRKALSASPMDPAALVLLGRLRATLGNVDEAVGLYRRALEASPAHAPAHHALAKVFAFQQRCAAEVLSPRIVHRVEGLPQFFLLVFHYCLMWRARHHDLQRLRLRLPPFLFFFCFRSSFTRFFVPCSPLAK